MERAPLVERDYKVHTEDRVGKAVVITSATPKNEQGGFYCEVRVLCGARVSAADCDVGAQVCDCTLKDSVAWLDHINGKKHNRALGYIACAAACFFSGLMFGGSYSMKVERASVSAVQKALSE